MSVNQPIRSAAEIGVPAVAVSGTPTVGEVLTATSGTAADWQTAGGGSQTLAQVLAAGNSANSLKITGLANGSAASDAAAFGQIPAVPVASVFTRTGAVVAASGDYTAAQVTNAADLSNISVQTFAGGVKVQPTGTAPTLDWQVLNKAGTRSVSFTDATGALKTGNNTLDDGSGGMQVGNLLQIQGGSDTSQAATIATQAVSSGSAFTPSSANDVELVVPVTFAGTVSMTMGPSTGAENSILSSQAVVAGTVITKRIPKGWKVVITLTTATLGTVTKQLV